MISSFLRVGRIVAFTAIWLGIGLLALCLALNACMPQSIPA